MSDQTTETPVAVVAQREPWESVPHWILLDTTVSANAVRLYLILKKHAKNGKGTSFPTRRRLADQIGVSAATVDRAKAELIEVGAICQRQRKSEAGDWTSNLYHVHWDKSARCAFTGEERCPTGDETPTAGDETGVLTGDEQTHTQSELTPTELTFTADAVTPPPAPETITAQHVVGAYVDRHTQVHGEKPPSRSLGRMARESRQLLDEGKDAYRVIDAAMKCAEEGHANISSAYTWLLAAPMREVTRSGKESATSMYLRLVEDPQTPELEQ